MVLEQREHGVRTSGCPSWSSLVLVLDVFQNYMVYVPSVTRLSVPHILLQSVAFIPLDAIGHAYVDWVLSRDEMPRLVNVVHPRPTSWDVILRGLRAELGEGLPRVTLAEWVAKLEAYSDSPTEEDLSRIVSNYGSCLRASVEFSNIYSLRSNCLTSSGAWLFRRPRTIKSQEWNLKVP